MPILRTPAGGTVKVVERGEGAPAVFLHSGIGSAGEWREVFARWPEGHRLLALDAYRGGSGPGMAGRRTLGDYADQVLAVVDHAGGPVHLVGFSWGGATALHVGLTRPDVLRSLSVVEPEAYSVLRDERPEAYAEIAALRDRWRAHVQAGRWDAAYAEFVDFYNGPGSFARWPDDRRAAFLAEQRAKGDLWDVLFEAPLTGAALTRISVSAHVVEGTETSSVDHAICDVVRERIPHARHSLIAGAGHMLPLTHAPELTRVLVAGLPGGNG
jgi:pimeloyl-ACP methyl ester carboxylesterase